MKHTPMGAGHFVILLFIFCSNFVKGLNQIYLEIEPDLTVLDTVCRTHLTQFVRHASMGGLHLVIVSFAVYSNFVMALNRVNSKLVLDWAASDPVCGINRTQLVRHTSTGVDTL